MHRAAVIAAAEAKKAILCEKPLGNSSTEVREMVCAARGERRAPDDRLHVALQRCFSKDGSAFHPRWRDLEKSRL